MKIGDAEYDALVERLSKEKRLHKVTQMTEEETQAEIQAIQGGARSSFAESDVQDKTVMEVQPIPPQPKRRGRPPGSRNKPKP